MTLIGKLIGTFATSVILSASPAIADVPVTLGYEFVLSLDDHDPRRANGAAYDCLVFDVQDDEGARLRISGTFKKYVSLHRGGGCVASQVMSLEASSSFANPNDYRGVMGPLLAGSYSVLVGASESGDRGAYTVAFDKWDGSTFRTASPASSATAPVAAASVPWTLLLRADDGHFYVQPVERFVGRPSMWVRLEILDRTIPHRSERIRFVAFCLTGKLTVLRREQYAQSDLGGVPTILEGPFGSFTPEPGTPFHSVLERACANEDMLTG